jgi:hypothetical protein
MSAIIGQSEIYFLPEKKILLLHSANIESAVSLMSVFFRRSKAAAAGK